jgi:hypothetical protein
MDLAQRTPYGAILEIPLRYAQGVDRRNWLQVRQCFSDDAVGSGSLSSGSIDDYLEVLRKGVEYFSVTMHFMGNQLVDFDEERALVETYAIAHHYRGDPPGSPHPDNLIVGVRYNDTIVEQTNRYVIIERKVDPLWRQGNYPSI